MALLRNLARALFQHERIVTTVAKAKELRPFAEKLITLAKKGTLHHRRLAIARLGDPEMVAKLFKEIGPRFADRPGGYTRVIKRHQVRLGDAGPTALIELLKPGERKPEKKRPEPVAPRVTEEPPARRTEAPPSAPAETPAPETSAEGEQVQSTGEETASSQAEAEKPEGEQDKPAGS
jgi:large subunit ribosomal protein L17